jgi:hypothetical protein
MCGVTPVTTPTQPFSAHSDFIDRPKKPGRVRISEVESPAESASFRDEQSPVLAVEIEDAKSPVIRIVVGKEDAMT